MRFNRQTSPLTKRNSRGMYKQKKKEFKNTQNIKMHFTLFNLQNLCFCVTMEWVTNNKKKMLTIKLRRFTKKSKVNNIKKETVWKKFYKNIKEFLFCVKYFHGSYNYVKKKIILYTNAKLSLIFFFNFYFIQNTLQKSKFFLCYCNSFNSKKEKNKKL